MELEPSYHEPSWLEHPFFGLVKRKWLKREQQLAMNESQYVLSSSIESINWVNIIGF